MYNKIEKSIDFAGQKLTFETGELAPRADASVLARLGETVVLVTVTVSKENTDRDYFPLNVEYVERYYAGGVISGSRYIKRERFPSERAVLVARQVDHSIRSLFPKGFAREVAVTITLMAYDGINDPELLTVNATSAALMMSSVPFNGPSASVKIGLKEGSLVLNPSIQEEEELDMSMVVSCTKDAVLNIEGWADEVPEETLDQVFDLAMQSTKELLDFQTNFVEGHKKTKIEYKEAYINEDAKKFIEEKYTDKIKEGLFGEKRDTVFIEVAEKIKEEKDEFSKSDISNAIEYIARKIMRESVLKEEKRTSGRKLDEIREIFIKPGYLPRVHGSAMFARGVTQVLSVVTLGSTRLEQSTESYSGEETKRFMHHYIAAPFSLGEAGRYNFFPGRREIGHGAIGENALKKMVPSVDNFPYTIRVASEVLGQNGSSSMGSTCAASLALMDAGVPIKAHVAGVAMGLVTNDDQSEYKLLTDMQDVEDFYGDMDFKVTGTLKGITAIQLDNKLMGIKPQILKDAMRHSKKGREFILAKMNTAIDKARNDVSEYAPKVGTASIVPEKIGELIGPGGKNVKAITEATGVDIDIQDDGKIFLAGPSKEALEEAKKMINDIGLVVEVGQVFEGTVAKLMPFGAFVDITPSVSGLVHVSEMSDKFVKDPAEIVKEGDIVTVKVKKIDEQGKISLTMKGVEKENK